MTYTKPLLMSTLFYGSEDRYVAILKNIFEKDQ